MAKLKSKLSDDDLNTLTEPLDIVYKVDEAQFSDLEAKEIPDDMVSDIDDLQATGEEVKDANGVAQAQAALDQLVEDKNLAFMTDFVQKYSQDSNAAK